MITKIGVENFRIFKDQEIIELKPLTVLTGPNSSGKSTFQKALQVIKEGFELNKEGEIDFTRLNFDRIRRLGTFEKNTNNASENKEITFYIEYQLEDERVYKAELSYIGKGKNGELNRLRITHNGKAVFSTFVHSDGQCCFDADDIADMLEEIKGDIFLESSVFEKTALFELVMGGDSILNKEVRENESLLQKLHNELLNRSFNQEDVMPWMKDLFRVLDEVNVTNKEQFLEYIKKLEYNFTSFFLYHITFGTAYLSHLDVSKFKNVDFFFFEHFIGSNKLVDPYEPHKLSYKDNGFWRFMDQLSFDKYARYNAQDDGKLDFFIGDAGDKIIEEHKMTVVDALQKHLDSLTNILNEFNQHLDFIPHNSAVEKHYLYNYEANSQDPLINFGLQLADSNMDAKIAVRQYWVNKWVKDFDIADALIANPILIDNEPAGVSFYLKYGKQSHPAYDEGKGINMLLLLMIRIMSAKDNMRIILEEPECNLHPAYQSKLAEMLADAYNMFGVQFIIETHSEYLIRKIQHLVAMAQSNKAVVEFDLADLDSGCDWEKLLRVDGREPVPSKSLLSAALEVLNIDNTKHFKRKEWIQEQFEKTCGVGVCYDTLDETDYTGLICIVEDTPYPLHQYLFEEREDPMTHYRTRYSESLKCSYLFVCQTIFAVSSLKSSDSFTLKLPEKANYNTLKLFVSLLANFIETFELKSVKIIVESMELDSLLNKLFNDVNKSKLPFEIVDVTTLKASDVSIYYLNSPKRMKKGDRQVRQLEIREDGILKQDFGSGFFDESTRLTMDLLTLQNIN